MTRGDPLDPVVGKPFEQKGAAPIEEQKPIEDVKPAPAPDAALAVNAADLQALVEHARQTGAEALAAKFPNL